MDNRTSFIQFHAVLKELEDSNVRVRLRASGEPWGHFSAVVLVSENAIVLEKSRDQHVIVSLRQIVEFEIEKPVGCFREKTVYAIG